jgi:transcriptional regulator with XRE-family HTH domain
MPTNEADEVSAPDESCGARLRFARGLTGLKAHELSVLAGFAAGYVGLIENNRRSDLRISTVKRLSTTLGVDFAWLAIGQGAPPTAKVVRKAIAQAQANQAA